MSELQVQAIEPVEVMRDAEGWWSHPQYLMEPEFEDVDALTLERYRSYLTDRGVESSYTTMESDDYVEFERYCETGDANCSAWTPLPPDGTGWFILSIHDTEDGPICVWGRKLKAQTGETMP